MPAFLKTFCHDCGNKKDPRSQRCKACYTKIQTISDSHKLKLKEALRAYCKSDSYVHSQLGKKQSEETIRKRLESRGMNYSEGPSWTKGTRGQMNAWARAVKKRDKHCVYCGSKEKLHAHHILSKHKHPDWSLFIDNGITLCHQCHWAEHRTNGYL